MKHEDGCVHICGCRRVQADVVVLIDIAQVAGLRVRDGLFGEAHGDTLQG